MNSISWFAGWLYNCLLQGQEERGESAAEVPVTADGGENKMPCQLHAEAWSEAARVAPAPHPKIGLGCFRAATALCRYPGPTTQGGSWASGLEAGIFRA